MKSSDISSSVTSSASSREGINAFLTSESSETASTITLSDAKPNAFIKIAKGIFLGTDGKLTFKLPSFDRSMVTGARTP